MKKEKHHSEKEASQEREEDDRSEAVSEVVEKGQEFLGMLGEEKDDGNVVHCPKCYRAEQAERYAKAATLFSLGAFVMSVAAVAIPFLWPISSGFSPDQWETFQTMLEDHLSTGSAVSPSSQAAAVPPASAKPVVRPASAKTSSKSVAVPSSVAPASSAAVLSAASVEVSSAAPADGTVNPADPAAAAARSTP